MTEGSLLVTKELLLRYAWASGDYNSIHFDAEDAKANRLPGIIVHGMLLLGLINKKIEDFLTSKKALNLFHLECRFVSMAFLGDVLSVKLEEVEFNAKAFPHVQTFLHISVIRTNDANTVAAVAKAQLTEKNY